MKLTREIRLSLSPMDGQPVMGRLNRLKISPMASPLLGSFVAIRCTVTGPVNPDTGYLCDIRMLDSLVRQHAQPHLQHVFQGEHPAHAGPGITRALFETLDTNLPDGLRLTQLTLWSNPNVSFQAQSGAPRMITMTQRFEFAASHRLHAPTLSEEQNARIFGRCSNPNGHGHNYIVDITVAGEPDATTGLLLPSAAFEQTVRTRLIDRFDHKHLNLDCSEFANLNPSVENIASVAWRILDGRFEPCVLTSVKVWETAKTSAEVTRTG